MAEPSPFHPVKASCHRLWEEWERMMDDAERATNQMLSSFKTQEESLLEERTQVLAVQADVAALRRSFVQQIHVEEEKLLVETVAAERISKNITIQFAELKQMQCHLAGQLARLKSIIEDIRDPKFDENKPKLVRWATEISGRGSNIFLQDKEILVPGRGDPFTNKTKFLKQTLSSPDVLPDKFAQNVGANSVPSGSRNDNGKSLFKAVQLMEWSDMNIDSEVSTNQDGYQGMDHQQNSGLETDYICNDRTAHNYTSVDHKRTGGLSIHKTNALKLVNVKAEPVEEELPHWTLTSEEEVMHSVDHKRIGELTIHKTNALKLVNVKAEPIEEWTLTGDDEVMHSVLYGAKFETEALQDDLDELDHMPLLKRLELFRKSGVCKEDLADDEKFGTSAPYDKSFKKKAWNDDWQGNSTKRLKCYRVPVEIALQEDAPGLLEKLQEKGLLEDVQLYGGCVEDDFVSDTFKDLEHVISKLWSTPTGLFKQPHIIRQHLTSLNKGPTYCLSCLVSLIEQTRSLKQRNWPVEWGWCRQLQAFLFVFEKHNRIVLERPEYGNATYFFELVQPVPVKWQVERVIRVLSVTAVGKTALLENRPLELGNEVSVDEAKILEDYGWTPSTGLGSFLNFCDRVVHDVKDDDNSEWRQRIGKCLMDGHDRGRITVQKIPQMLQTPEFYTNMVKDGDCNEDMKLVFQI